MHGKYFALAVLAACLFVCALGCALNARVSCGPVPRAQLAKLAASIDAYRMDTGKLPIDLRQMLEPGPPGLGPYLRAHDLRDPWGRLFYYRIDEDGRGFVLFTLGRDGRIGGYDGDLDRGVVGP